MLNIDFFIFCLDLDPNRTWQIFECHTRSKSTALGVIVNGLHSSLVLRCISYILLWSFFWSCVNREYNGNFNNFNILFKLSGLLNQLYYRTHWYINFLFQRGRQWDLLKWFELFVAVSMWLNFCNFFKKTQHLHQKCLTKDTAKQSGCCSAFHCFSCCQVITVAFLHSFLRFGFFYRKWPHGFHELVT